MMPLISVIIPVYNTEKYIADCLNSVIFQMGSDVECVVVDDGSLDSSLDICMSLKESHPDYNINIIHQRNMGLSCARNTGMKAASGKYISFLDSDDMLSDGAIDCLKVLANSNSDIDVFLYDAEVLNETDDPHPNVNYDRADSVIDTVVSGEEFFCNWYLDKKVVSACMCLYKAEFLKQKDFIFTPGKLHEDVLFSFKITVSAKKVLYVPRKLYIRRVRDGSITTIVPNTRHYEGVCSAFLDCLDYVENSELIQEAENKKELFNAFCRYLCFGIDNIIWKCEACNGSLDLAETVLNRMLEYLLEEHDYHSYSWLYTLHKLVSLSDSKNLDVDNDNKLKVEDEFSCAYGQDFISALEGKMSVIRQSVILNIPLDNENKKIGIYGMGVHTNQMLSEYTEQKEIKAKIFYVDSYKTSQVIDESGSEIFNVKDIPEDTDEIIVSSWVHRSDMLIQLKRYVKNIKIIDLYEVEKTPYYG